MENTVFFLVGGRYENRIGWYTGVRMSWGVMIIRYDSDTVATIDDLRQQERFGRRLAAEKEALKAAPKPKAKPQSATTAKGWRRDPYNPAAFYFGLGFLACRVHIEAHVPQKNQREFEEDYTLFTGQRLIPGLDRYYIFPDPNIQKWAPDMRIAWRGTPTEYDVLYFGPDIEIKYDEPADECRINKSSFVRNLFSRGFRMGSY